MSEKRYASKKTLRSIFGCEESYKQGKQDMVEWLKKEIKKKEEYIKDNKKGCFPIVRTIDLLSAVEKEVKKK